MQWKKTNNSNGTKYSLWLGGIVEVVLEYDTPHRGHQRWKASVRGALAEPVTEHFKLADLKMAKTEALYLARNVLIEATTDCNKALGGKVYR